jgi:hypothetical protein
METGKPSGKLDPNRFARFGQFIDHLNQGGTGGGTKPPPPKRTPPPTPKEVDPPPPRRTPTPPREEVISPPPPRRTPTPTPEEVVSTPPRGTPPPTERRGDLPPPRRTPPPTPRPTPTASEARLTIQNTGPEELARLSFDAQVDLLGPITGEVKSTKSELGRLKGRLGSLAGTEKLQAERRVAELEQQLREHQEACNKLYRVMPLDRDFKAKDRQQRQQYLNVLARDENLQKLSDPETWKIQTAEVKKHFMQQAVNAQYAILCPGKTAPPITLKYWPDDADEEKRRAVAQGGTKPQGYYSPGDHSIVFWVYNRNNSPGVKEEGPLADFGEAIDTAIHETSHAQQHELIRKVESGELRPPPSPENWQYAQAKLFQLNNDAYEDGSLDNPAYKNEPMEKHAWLAGGTAALLFNWDAKAIEMRTKLDRAAGRYPEKQGALDTIWEGLQGDKPLAEKAAVFLDASEKIDKILAEVEELRVREEGAFTEAQRALDLAIRALPTLYKDSPPAALRARLQKAYGDVIDMWNKGPAINITKCKSLLTGLKGKYEQLGEAGRAYAAYQGARGEMIDAANALPNPIPSDLFPLYERLRGFGTEAEELFAAASRDLNTAEMDRLKGQMEKVRDGYVALKKKATTK